MNGKQILHKKRILILKTIFLAVALVLVGRLCYLSMFDSKELSLAAKALQQEKN